MITGEYGAMVLGPLLADLDAGPTTSGSLPVPNAFFGGNIAVTGLLTGVDIARALAGQPVGHRYLLPDVCLSEGRFLDGMTAGELPRAVEIIPTDGLSLPAGPGGAARPRQRPGRGSGAGGLGTESMMTSLSSETSGDTALCGAPDSSVLLAAAKSAIAAATDDEMKSMWTLLRAGKPIFTMPHWPWRGALCSTI